ncbi:MAG: cadherin domain-containing protein [Kiloniellales bacterium]|nr:cadherin domain-containing protein [Kiloniellales bacterium]
MSYSLSDDAGGRFAIDSTTGVVTVADSSQLDYETATSHTVEVTATSTDGSTSVQSFTVNLTDDTSEAQVGAISDSNASANSVSESAVNGTAVGVTALATDADATDTVSYSLSDDAGGRFDIDSTTGVVTVANSSLLDYETATSHTVEVTATSTDGSTSVQSFTINLTDDTAEDAVGAVSDSNASANTVSESAVNGTAVGVTALATDPDATDTVSYSLSDDAGGRFDIDASTGVVTVAENSLLDYETATSHTVEVTATSTDGSTATQSFTINLTDDTAEAAVGPVSDSNASANSVSESAVNGTAVGVTALATDADATDTVSYSLSDDAGGRFNIDSTTGVVTVADNLLLDYETATSHTVEVTATSTDGSTATQSFTVNLTDDTSEAQVGPVTDSNASANTVSESAVNGTAVGVTALATDADGSDTVSYSLSNDAGGRFDIDSSTGVVTVADNSLLDYETATSHTVEVTATSTDGSTSVQSFTINLTDDTGEASVSAVSDSNASANTVSESAVNGTAVGVTALATDADATDTVSYSLSDNAGGRFDIDSSTGVVTVANSSLLDYETATSHTLEVTATSTDGSTATQSFTINLTDDTAEDAVGSVTDSNASANTVSESAVNGTAVGITALATDADATDTVSYSLSDDAGGRFDIDSSTGVVTVANSSLLDYETATSHTVEVTATSTDGSTSIQSFTINLSDDNTEYSVSAVADSNASANTISESAVNGTAVGVTALATDADATDTVSYSLSDDAGGRFDIDSSTGVVTVANSSLLDYETATSHAVEVTATSTDGTTTTQTFTVNLTDDTAEDAVGAVSDSNASANTVSESAANGTAVGVTALATDPDASDSVTYALSDDAGGRFDIDGNTGVVTVADNSLLDYETATSHTVEVTATSTDGSTSIQSFTINLSDDNTEYSVSAVSDTDASASTISESAANGTAVGITALATDADATDTVSYSLSDDAGGRFDVDSSTGVVTVADSSLLDYETATSHTVEVTATSTDGTTSTQTFTINLTDDTAESSAGPVTDSDASANTVAENAADGTVVGVTALATDTDATDSVTYSLSDDAGGRFEIDGTTGVVTVADGSLLDHEAADSHTLEVTATSTDGSTSTQSFTVNVGDVNEAPTDIAFGTSVDENAANGTLVNVAIGSDPDDGDTMTYSLDDDAGGRFQIDSSSGEVRVANGSLLDFETDTSHDITIRVTDSGGLDYAETFTITVDDLNEAPTVTTGDSTGNEDTAIPLTINLADLEPGATQSVLIAGVPSGATLSAGTDNGDGTWTLTSGELGGLTITPPQHSDDDFQLTVTASSDDGSTVETSAPQTIDVTVDPVADTPNLSATNTASGSQDGAVEVEIPPAIMALDGDPSLSVTISNVPSGATLSAGTDNGDGTWTLVSGELDQLVIEPPAGDDTNFTLNIEANYSGQENPVNDGFASGAGGFTYSDDTFRGTSQSNYATGNWGASDGETGGGLLVELGGVDGVDITDGMSGGFSQTFNVSNAGTGSITFSYRMEQDNSYENNEYSQVLISLDGNLIGTGGNDYVAQLNGGGDTGWQTVTIDLGSLSAGNHTLTLGGFNNQKTTTSELTEIRFDDVDLTVDYSGTINDTFDVDPNFVELSVSSSLVDTDGSESLSILVSGVPTGASLSAGTDNGDGTWTLDSGELSGLQLFPPEDYTGTFQLTVTATATDGSDTADAVETIDVTITPPINLAPTDMDLSANTVSESATNGASVGTISTTDSFPGETFSYALTDDAGGRFTIDSSTGEVTVADGGLLDYESATSHTVTVEVTDSAANTYSESFTINLTDDTSEFSASAISDGDAGANEVSDTAADGATVGITAAASDADASDTVTYSLSDDAGGRFAIDGNTGVVTVADNTLLDYDVAASHDIEVTATSTDGSTSTQTFTIDLNEAPSDLTFAGNSALTTDASAADTVATASVVNPSGGQTYTFTLTDNAGGLFQIDSSTGAISAVPGDANFTEQTGSDNPFDGIDIGTRSTPTFADIDGDGDLDAFIGEDNGTINYYENTGTSSSPTFTQQTGGSNPFDGVDIGARSTPVFADIDGDGDLDAFIGESSGNINYYENTGDSSSPAFTQKTGGSNPLDGVDIGARSAPTFVDIDGDGDLDAFIGEYDGNINYYENTGDSGSPTFTQQTGGSNPFDGVDVGRDSKPTFVDVDGDGDLDAFIGEASGNINYYENTGDSSSPTFTQQTGASNPFDGVDIGSNSAPVFADLDGDGDVDAFIGENTGNINYYENSASDVDLSGLGSQTVTVEVEDSNGNTYSEDLGLHFGSAGADDTTGTANDDVMYGFDGADTLNGGDGDDWLHGGAGGSIDFTSGSETQSNTTTSDTQKDGAVAALDDGGYVVVWQNAPEDEEETNHVYAQRYDADGNAVGGEITIGAFGEEDTTSLFEADVTGLVGGGFVVTWAEPTGEESPDNVMGRVYDSNGNPAGSEFTINSTTGGTQDAPTIAATPDGGFVAVWDGSGSGDSSGVFGQRYDSGGNEVGGEFLVNTTTSNTQSNPSITVLNDGGFVVTWEGEGTGDSAGVFGQIYNSSGTAVGSEFRVNTTTSGTQSAPTSATLTNGDFVVVWESDGQDGSGTGVYAQRFDSSGTAIGSEVQINDTTSNDQGEPEIAALPDGGYMIVWQSDSQDGGGTGVYAKQFDSGGTDVSGEVLVNSSTSGDQGSPDVAVLNSGDVVVTWDGSGSGDSSGVYSHVYQDTRGDGGAEGDTLDGGAGTDTASYEGSSAAVTVDLDAGTGIGGDAEADILSNIENLVGSDHNDVLTGDSGINTLWGGEGDDTLTANGGDDTLYGEEGSDLFIINEDSSAFSATVEGGDGGGWTDVIELRDQGGGDPTDGWTYQLDSGTVESSGADFLDLSDDAAGMITLVDGSTIDFTGIERIEW